MTLEFNVGAVEIKKGKITLVIYYLRLLFLPVITPERQCCQNPGDKVIVTTNQGLISNHVTQSSGCGGIDCPWALEASPGQMLNLSLFDFNTYRMVSDFLFRVMFKILILNINTIFTQHFRFQQ